MNVWIGNAQNEVAMTTMLWEDAAMKHTVYRMDTKSFTVPSTGTYYIGFHMQSPPNYYHVFIDDVHPICTW